jgi:FkbM family methyltransferase
MNRKPTIRAIRSKLRMAFDRLFFRPRLGVRALGAGSVWHIDPTLLSRGATVIAGGAGKDISFELQLAREFGCKVHLFDPSPTGRATAEAVTQSEPRLLFYPLGLAAQAGAIRFGTPLEPMEGSFTVAEVSTESTVAFNCKTVPDILRDLNLTEAALLKLDIEGFEYEVIDDLLDRCGAVFEQIAVEFHHFLPSISKMRTLRTIQRLKRAGYVLSHKCQCDYLFVRNRPGRFKMKR